MKKFFRLSLNLYNFVLANLVVFTLSVPLGATWNDDLQTLTTEELTSKCRTKLKFYRANLDKKSKWETRLETIQNVTQTMGQPLHEAQNYLGGNLILSEPPQEKEESSSNPIVLVVDDSSVDRKCVKQCFLKKNYHVVEARDGQEAITLCLNQTFYCIMMDWEMPVSNGPTTTKRLCTELNLTIPIFGLTSRTQENYMQEFISMGATHVFSKPFNKDKLSELITIVDNLKLK